MGESAKWESTPLGELGQFRNGVNFSQEDYGPGLPIVNVKQLYGGRYAQTRELLELRPSAVRNPELVQLQPGDVLFARSSVKASGAGQVAMVGPCPRGAVFSGFIIRFRVAALDRATPEFLNYVLRSPTYRELLTRIGSGTTITNLSQGTLAAIEVDLPPLPEQRAISRILGTLDDKIELNRRMSETLEAMARALFKSWFVDFDAVRAKAEGRDPGLPQALADLFPDSFEDSELGEIPKGWGVTSLGDILELAYGKALKADDRCEGNIPVYGSNGQVGWHDERLVAGPGIVVGRKGNPGIATWVSVDFFPIDTTFYVVSKLAGQSLAFLFHVLRTHDLASLGADSAVPGLNRNLAYMSRQVLPPVDLLAKFDGLASAFTRLAHQANEQSHLLAGLRDSLLPGLISGQLRLKSNRARPEVA